MSVLETERLVLRELRPEDAEFILVLLNEPSFLRYIGDRQVRTVDDARRYIEAGPVDSYARNGFGLYLVERREDRAAMGLCGLLKRDVLPDPDLGFAFLPAYWASGYAREAALATVADARDRLGLRRILAITSPDNQSSMKLLGRIGFSFEREVRMSPEEPEVRLFAVELGAEQPMPS
jgi:[ribosomal protein S5]-alanine N-acetyltransferase